ncbi:MAG: hypothetical protein ABEJ40_08940 [Haloarculaceae archaeon]
MATETAEEDEAWDPHLRGMTVTTIASLLGLLAGVASQAVAPGQPGNQVGQFIVAGAVLVQLPLYAVMGIDVADFGVKEHLYIAFITFSLWFVTWGILLTTGATI